MSRLELFGMDPGLLREQTAEFRKQVEVRLPALRAAIGCAEFRTARLHAYTFKGSARIADGRCAAAAERLERLMAAESIDGADALPADFEREVRHLLGELTA